MQSSYFKEWLNTVKTVAITLLFSLNLNDTGHSRGSLQNLILYAFHEIHQEIHIKT